MDVATTYTEASKYLNEIFDLLNERFFENALSKPVITIQDTPKAYGHYTLYNAWEVEGQGQREINISAGNIGRSIVETVATMLHEMVHEWNDQNEINDCSRTGT